MPQLETFKTDTGQPYMWSPRQISVYKAARAALAPLVESGAMTDLESDNCAIDAGHKAW